MSSSPLTLRAAVRASFAALLAHGLLACGAPPADDAGVGDAGLDPTVDAGPRPDAGEPPADAGPRDGSTTVDAGPPGDAGDACEGVRCSDHGACVLAAGLAACECEAGYVARGLSCIPDPGDCRVTAGAFDVDFETATLSGRVTLGGAAFDRNSFDVAQIMLVRADLSDYAVIATLGSYEGEHFTYSADVVHGTYDVYYAVRNGRDWAPTNAFIRIGSSVVVDADRTLDVDVPMAEVSGAITIDGAAPGAGSGSAYLALERDLGGAVYDWLISRDFARLADVRDGAFTTQIVPGTYRLVYYGGSGVDSPGNSGAVLDPAVVITGDRALDVDLSTARVTGRMLLEGAPFAADQYARVSLRSATLGGVGLTDSDFGGGVFDVRVLRGSYDVVYHFVDGSDLPRNTSATLGSRTIVADAAFDVDVPMVELSGNYTLDGAPGTGGGIELLLEGEPDYLLGSALAYADGTYRAPLVPGRYEIFTVNEFSSRADRAANGLGSLEVGLDVLADGVHDIAIDAPLITFEVTQNGAPLSTSCGGLQVRRTHDRGGRAVRGDVASLPGLDTVGPIQARLLAGTYDIYYGYYECDPEVPLNKLVRVAQGVVIEAARTVSVDVATLDVSGALTEAGVGVEQRYFLRLYTPDPDRDIDPIAALRYDGPGRFGGEVAPGTYDLRLRVSFDNRDGARNQNAYLGCVALEP